MEAAVCLEKGSGPWYMNKHVLLMGAKGMEEQLSAPQGLARDWTVVQLGSLRSGALGLTRGSR